MPHFIDLVAAPDDNAIGNSQGTYLTEPNVESRQEASIVIGNTKERWRELCEQASVEQDAEKLLELVKEINQLLEEKRTRLADKTKKQI
jgi:hypothetical protein